MQSALPPVEGATATEDLLNSILPPREWTEDNQLWVQYVSSTPATRLDVVNLQEHLDRKLQQRQARETGICPVREELYAQAFDELIRQVGRFEALRAPGSQSEPAMHARSLSHSPCGRACTCVYVHARYVSPAGRARFSHADEGFVDTRRTSTTSHLDTRSVHIRPPPRPSLVLPRLSLSLSLSGLR